jgi:hypothetical protein
MTALVASGPLKPLPGELVLSHQALNDLEATLSSFGSSLSPSGRTALQALLESLEAGLRGILPPSYYLSAIDPGTGKSLAVASFLKAWKACGFLPDSSVLVGVSSLAEVDSYLQHAGLSREEVGVLTRNEPLNALGAPKAAHGATRVLFTTQQMIQNRTRGRLFADAADFHYQGKPRNLRIWDESLTLGGAVTLRVDDLGLLASPLRQKNPAFVEAVKAFQRLLWDASAGQAIQVPHELNVPLKAAERLPADALETLDRLKKLAGQEVRLVDGSNGDIQLSGASPALPDDFAPAVILDASGRVRSTYKLWEERLGTLTRLPAAASDYRNLDLHLWPRGSGKQSMTIPSVRAAIVRAMADVINEDDEDWLVIHYKDQPAIFRDLMALVEHRADERLHALTWGRHHGTNRFAGIRNIMIVGQLTYGEAAYRSKASAAVGGGAVELTSGELAELESGEFSHHLLQALCRASVRSGQGGVAGACRAYVVANPLIATPERLHVIFPGSRVGEWRPAPPTTAKGHAGSLIAYLADRFAAQPDGLVTKSDARATLGLSTAAFAKLLRHPAVADFMAGHHMVVDHRSFESHKARFDPWVGG